MQQRLSHFAVIRQEQRALGIEVEPAHGEDPDMHAME